MPKLKPFVKGFFTNIFCLILIGVILWVHFLILHSEDLTDVDFGDIRDAPPKDILFRANEVINSGRSFQCSEAALNQYLGVLIKGSENKLIDNLLSFDKVAIRLRDGEFDLILIRRFNDKPLTFSARFRVVSGEKGIEISVKSGRFGRLHVPGGFVSLLYPGILNIVEILEQEKEMLTRPISVTIRKDWLTLTQRKR
ncbi:MAG: hypothetical protein CMO49_06540 [Verrucomicrobiales bacterium]|nr:hypothetical protein [Verrucomicrobiales bacterium]